MTRNGRLLHTCAALSIAALITGCSGSGGGSWSPSQSVAAPSPSAVTHVASSSTLAAYRAEGLPSLGGGFAAGISDNEQAWISGFSLTATGAVRATLWLPASNAPVDLGTLGGSNSAVEWPNHASQRVVGIAQLARTDPLGEQWSCSYPAGGGFLPYTGQECRGFVWTQSGGMTQLGTLGGNNSFAAGANASGQIAGWAETGVADPTCVSPQVLGFNAVVWNGSGSPRALASYGQDPDSAATAINGRGDVAGISGICENAVGALSAEHMILWRNGVPTSIGTLGGSAWNTPEMLNDQDDVVGFSDRPGDDNGNNFNAHAFLWTPANGLQDLGTLSGDAVSYAYSINDAGLIVGQSCTAGCASSRAFLYQNGSMYDLNTLLDTASSSYDLIFANDINNRGQITGLAIDSSNGSIVGFRLIPTDSPANVRRASGHGHARPRYRLRVGPFGRAIPPFRR